MYTLNYVFSAAKIGVRMQETVTVIDRGSDPRRLNPRLSLRFVGSNQRCLSHLSRKAQFYGAVEEHSYNRGQKQKSRPTMDGQLLRRCRVNSIERRRPDSNRRSGFCRPLPYHLATSPSHTLRWHSHANYNQSNFICLNVSVLLMVGSSQTLDYQPIIKL